MDLPPVSASRQPKKKKAFMKKPAVQPNPVTDWAADDPQGLSFFPAAEAHAAYPNGDADTVSNASFSNNKGSSSPRQPKRNRVGRKKNKGKSQAISGPQTENDEEEWLKPEPEGTVDWDGGAALGAAEQGPQDGSRDAPAQSQTASAPAHNHPGGSFPQVDKLGRILKAFSPSQQPSPEAGAPGASGAGKVHAGKSKKGATAGQKPQNQPEPPAQAEAKTDTASKQEAEEAGAKVKVELDLVVELPMTVKIRGQIMLTFM
jgi:hypothetical protein